MSMLNGILLANFTFLILYRFQLSVYFVELGVRDNKYMAVHVAFGILLDFQLDSVFDVHKVRAAAMHFLISHGVQISQKPELISGVELLHIHVPCFIFFPSQRSG